jgi:hypothetical protein
LQINTCELRLFAEIELETLHSYERAAHKTC